MIPDFNSTSDKTIWDALRRAGAPLRLRKGRIIYLQGQLPQSLYYLVQGRVRSFLVSDSGEERTLAFYGAGSLFGEASFFDEQPRMSSAAAVTDCEVAAVSREQILRLFQQEPAMALAMLKYLAQTVRLLSDQVEHVTFLSAGQRLIRVLLSLSDAAGALDITQEELATAIGASRVTVSRYLQKLAAHGWIETQYHRIRILNRAALEQARSY